MQPPRILIVDNNPAILEVVVRMLETDFVIGGTFVDGESVLREAPVLEPDVIILDISLGDLSGIEVARRLKELGSKARIVFLTIHEEPSFVRAAFAAGASGYVFKSHLNTDLIPAIEAARAGKTFISSHSSVQ